MTHLALHLTVRLEARITQRHALCLTARSEARNKYTPHVRQHRYSNRGRTPSVTTHITRSKINTPMFSRGKTPTGKHPRPQPTRPLGAVY
jgi:hypothetical protein